MNHTINRLSPEMREDFRTLVGLAKHDELGLVHTELDGKPVAVVMTVVEDSENPGNGGEMFPLAILVDEDLVKRLTNPFDEDNESTNTSTTNLPDPEPYWENTNPPHLG